MNNNFPNGYTSYNGYPVNDNAGTPVPEQKSAYEQQLQYNTPPQYPYMQPVPDLNKGTDILGILSVVFSSVGLGCCGIQFSVIGIITGIIAMVKAKHVMQKSSLGLVGVILGAVAIVLYIILIIAYFSIIAASMSELERLL